MKNDIRNEIRSYIVRSGFTMGDTVGMLAREKDWSESASNFSNKLSRGTLRYSEAKDIAAVLGYEIVWVKKS